MASLETNSLVAWMEHSGVPYKVTGMTEPGHAPHSYHYAPGTGGQGLAVDFAGVTAGRDSAQLDAIYQALVPLAPQCAELISGTRQWRNGVEVAPYDRADNIHTHVHVAVHLGWRPPVPEVHPMFDPPLPGFIAWLNAPAGGGWGMAADGAIYALGGAPYYGGPNGQPYFVGRTANRLVARTDGGYDIFATSGERYQYQPK